MAALVVVGGVVVGPFARLAEAAAAVDPRRAGPVDPAYHLDLRAENVMALARLRARRGSWLGASARWRPRSPGVARLGERLGPERFYAAALAGLDRLSDAVHDIEVRDLRARVAAVLVPDRRAGRLGFARRRRPTAPTSSAPSARDSPSWCCWSPCVAAALGATRPRATCVPVLALSVLGFALAGVYALFGAPDVALVAVLIETVLTLALRGRLRAAARRRPLAREAAPRDRAEPPWRDPLVGVVAGLARVRGRLGGPVAAGARGERRRRYIALTARGPRQ